MLIPQHASSASQSATPSKCDATAEADFLFESLSVKEVENALNVTRVTCAVGSDDISGRMLKISCKGMSSVVTYIF